MNRHRGVQKKLCSIRSDCNNPEATFFYPDICLCLLEIYHFEKKLMLNIFLSSSS